MWVVLAFKTHYDILLFIIFRQKLYIKLFKKVIAHFSSTGRQFLVLFIYLYWVLR